MKPSYWRIGLGVLFILMGGLFFIQQMGLLVFGGNFWSLVMGGAFLLGGLIFLLVLVQNRTNWWAVIPGMVLLGISANIFMEALFPTLNHYLGGLFILGGISASFWVIYFLNRTYWWAIIPGGVMATLALITVLDEVNGFESGALFFIGLAVTFALVAILPNGGKKMTWPWYPAAALGIFGTLVGVSSTAMSRWVWSVGIILFGVFLLVRNFRRS